MTVPQVTPLPCDTILYRTVTRASDLDQGEPLAAAFIPRPHDSDGLSVDFGVEVPDGCAPDLTGKKAILSLHAGHLRDIGLTALADSPTHAVIPELRFPPPDDLAARERMERYAHQLLAMCRVAWRK